MADKKVTGKKTTIVAKKNKEVTAKTSLISKPVKSMAETKKPEATKEIKTAVSASLSLSVFDINGKADGTVTLPKEIFGQPVNKQLIAQAIRVYQTNMSTHNAHTKTRGEVHGGGAKPWRQKGTGRARAGSSRSPLWVGGGKVFGPRYRNVKLALPQKMKHAALISALSAKAGANEIKVISGFEKIEPKTKIIINLLKSTNSAAPTLLVIPAKNENLKLAARNIQRVAIDTATNLNAYTIFAHKNILLSKEAIEKIK
jgi:large subunit ribosomal protein L4